MEIAKKYSVVGFFLGFLGGLLFWISPLSPSVDFDPRTAILRTSVFAGILFALIGFGVGLIVSREGKSG